MTITQRTATTNESNSTTSLTATRPGDMASGDLVVVAFAFTCTAASFTGPGGSWQTLLAPTQNSTATLAAYYMFDPGSDPSASTTDAAAQASWVCQAFGGVDTGTPLDVAVGTPSSTAGATTLAVTGVTTATDDAFVLSICMAGTTSRTLTISGLTEIVQYSHSSVGRALGMAGDLQASAGATGSKTWGNTASVSIAYLGFVAALRPGTDASISPAAVAATAAVPTATPSAGSTVSPDAVAATATVPEVLVNAVAPDAVAATTTIPTPTVTSDAAVSPAAIAATATVPAPTSIVAEEQFPAAALPITVQIYLNSAWTDITSYTYGRSTPAITIKRGRTAEGGSLEVQTAQLELDNRDGRFSPRNPTGPYYGQLTRNTPLSVSVEEGGPFLLLTDAGDYVSCPDSAGISVTGDLDMRVDLRANDWTSAGDYISKYEPTGDQRSWTWWHNADGTPQLVWSPDGTVGALLSATATEPVPFDEVGRLAVRVTLDVDNGQGGYTVTFYTASTIAGPWRQLGEPTVTTSGTTAVFDSTAPVVVGDISGIGYTSPVAGWWYSAEIRDGIGGTLVANPLFGEQAVGLIAFVDDQGNTWSLAGAASLNRTHVRFLGEVSEWPQKWDTTGRDAFVRVTASGVSRRLGQGQLPVSSVLRRAIPALTDLVAYWPLEDGEDVRLVAAGLPDVRGMVVTDTTASGGTAPAFGSNTSFKASGAIPVLNTGRLDAVVPAYTATGQTQVRWLMQVPSGGATDTSEFFKLYTSGTAAKWEFVYGTINGGSIALNVYDRNGASLLSGAYVDFDLDGRALRIHFGLTQNGSDIDYVIGAVIPGADTGSAATGTISSRTVGVVQRLIFNKHNDFGAVAVGHVTVEKTVNSVFTLGEQMNAYLNETAGARMQRIASENSEFVDIVGAVASTYPMGYQTGLTFLDLVKECAETDGGILAEPRDALSLVYRTRRSIERQNAKVSLSYPGHQMVDLEPVEDDRDTRNIVKVTRKSGGSATAELATGSLSYQSPPDGVGRYDSSVSLSLAHDLDAERQAYWRLHLGTVDEARYPRLRLNLASSHLTADQELVREILDLDVGDRLEVVDPPLWVPPDAITQVVQGYTERISQFQHEIEFNLAPESPYRVAVYDDGVSRYSSDGSTLDGAHNSATTSLSVATATGPLWSHSDGDFDIIVGGERMTVTNVTGSSSPQTFTVTRSVNGVTKSHSDGDAVELFEPYYYAL